MRRHERHRDVQRRDDRADTADLPVGVAGFNSGPYKLPVLRPASLALPCMPGVVQYPSPAQQPRRASAHAEADLPPMHRVQVTSNTVVHVSSELAAKEVLAEFAAAAIASFGPQASAGGRWSAYVGKHSDCAADRGHPDAFSRAFQMNGSAAEMARTRSSIGYGPSVPFPRAAALLTIRNVPPGGSEFYKSLPRRMQQSRQVTGKAHALPPILSLTNCTGYKGVSRTRTGRFAASIRLGGGTGKRCLGSFGSASQAGVAYASAVREKREAV